MKQSQRIVKNVLAGGFAVGAGGLLQLTAVVLIARSVSVNDLRDLFFYSSLRGFLSALSRYRFEQHFDARTG